MSSTRHRKRMAAIGRLRAGAILHLHPSGQWSFGSKFIPDRVARALPITIAHVEPDGRTAYHYQPALESCS